MKVKDRWGGERGIKRNRKTSKTQKKKQREIKPYKNFSNMKCHCATEKECPL